MNPFLDWSFKYLFGTERSKSNLIGLLNLILMPEHEIVEVEFLNNESIASAPDLKGCIFDLHCRDEKGDRYLIEMQNQSVTDIRERIIYYTCRMIDRMGERGREWNYINIKRVYSICLMNFTCEASPTLRRDIQLYDINEKTVFSDKINIILLQLPCLSAVNINDCRAYYEYLLYLLKEMQKNMKSIDQLKKEVAETQLPEATKNLFYKVLDTADVASLSEADRMRYESDLKNYRDTMSCIAFAKMTGKEKGKEEGKIEVAKSMKSKGLDISLIAECTGLSSEQIENL